MVYIVWILNAIIHSRLTWFLKWHEVIFLKTNHSCSRLIEMTSLNLKRGSQNQAGYKMYLFKGTVHIYLMILWAFKAMKLAIMHHVYFLKAMPSSSVISIAVLLNLPILARPIYIYSNQDSILFSLSHDYFLNFLGSPSLLW